MDIATGAMNTLLPKLAKLLVDEYNLQKNVKGEIEELEQELTSMKAALRKVSEVPVDQLDEQVKIWARDVRELSYDIEDAVDTFMDIMNQVKKASERRYRFKVDSVAVKPEAVTVDPRLEAMFRKATELVGIDGPKNELGKRLMEEDGSSR